MEYILEYWLKKYINIYIHENIEQKKCCSEKLEIKLNFENFLTFLDDRKSGNLKFFLMNRYVIYDLWNIVKKEIKTNSDHYIKGTGFLNINNISLFIDDKKIY